MNKQHNILLKIAIHTSMWLALFAMPYIVAYVTGAPIPRTDIGMVVMPMQLMLMFYINYFWLINKYLFKRKVLSFLAFNLVVILLISIILVYIKQDILPPPEHLPHKVYGDRIPFVRFSTVIGTLCLLVVLGLSVAIKMTNKWYEARQRVQELEKANTEAELKQLKSQLNPHFLFNSLNNIYALVTFDPDKAQLSIHSLCDMLRYQLYEATRENILIVKEIDFVRSYCELMELRLPQNISLTLDLPENVDSRTIAPLLFVSIIENAFKHGISQKKPSYVSIKISLEDEFVNCVVKNSYFPKADNDRSGSGIGLDNLKRRLELIYPDRYTFVAEKVDDDFVVRLTIRSNT